MTGEGQHHGMSEPPEQISLPVRFPSWKITPFDQRGGAGDRGIGSPLIFPGKKPQGIREEQIPVMLLPSRQGLPSRPQGKGKGQNLHCRLQGYLLSRIYQGRGQIARRSQPIKRVQSTHNSGRAHEETAKEFSVSKKISLTDQSIFASISHDRLTVVTFHYAFSIAGINLHEYKIII
jgi:hypothetical protein